MSTPETYSMLINGEWVAASDGATFPTSNPATAASMPRYPALGAT